MIKFFRRIRYKLLESGKTSQYLKYAVGEILLVVIGILIALQINNWNEANKMRQKEQQILMQLKSEYEANSVQLIEKIEMRNESLQSAIDLLNMIDNPDTFDEKVFYGGLWRLGRDPTFDPIKNDIIGSENLRILQNDSLIRALSNWSSDVYQVQEIELQFQKFRTENMIPCLNRLGVARNFQNEMWQGGFTPVHALDKTKSARLNINKTKRNINWDMVLSDAELEGIIVWSITLHQITNLQAQSLSERIDRILELLEAEIDHSD